MIKSIQSSLTVKSGETRIYRQVWVACSSPARRLLVVLSAETVFAMVAVTLGVNALTMSGEKRKVKGKMGVQNLKAVAKP